MASRPDVVITGAGVVSPIGTGCEPYWKSLCDRQSGVATIPELEATDFPVRFGGQITDFEPKKHVKPRKALKVMSREIQVGFATAAMATDLGQLSTDDTDSDRMGVVFGGHMQYCDPAEFTSAYYRCMEDGKFDFSRWGEAAMSQLYPLFMLMYLPNMIACHIAIAHDARGPNNTISVGDSSALFAIIEAAEIIQTGRADVMIAGGSSSMLSMTPMMYRGAQNLSKRNESPQTACRPFDLARDGSVSGEGGAAFLLESEQHAQARSAQILARLPGWGTAFEAPAPEAALRVRCIRRSFESALQKADMKDSEIGHINAGAAGLVDEDSFEALAIQKSFGDTPVTAPKSFFGNLGAAGGAVETVASLLALEHDDIPVTLNYGKPDPRCPINVVHQAGCRADQPSALILNQSSTGQAAAIVITRS